VAKKQPAPRRKRRTRDHEIADLGVNHVERQVLRCGYTLERFTHDYGLDFAMFTYDSRGEVDVGSVLIQVKATEQLKWPAGAATFPFRVSRTDLATWFCQYTPVILAVYDVAADRAYWVYVQAYCAQLPDFDLFRLGRSVTIHIPVGNILDEASVRRFAEFRDRIQVQFPKDLRHEE